jgi:hypothetical protein
MSIQPKWPKPVGEAKALVRVARICDVGAICIFTMTTRSRFPAYFATVAIALLASCASLRSTKKEGKFLIPNETLSPDGRYGVTVPVVDLDTSDNEPEPKNTLIQMRTRRVLTVINAETGFNRALNWRSEPIANWSRDGSLLLWTVHGKWSPYALVLLKVESDQVQWQRDLLTLAQQAILTRTREASPKKYSVAKKANEGNGSGYPEGFTVDVEALEPISLPLHLRAALTSNPKGIEGEPTLESYLEGEIDNQGNLMVTEFKLGHASWHTSY